MHKTAIWKVVKYQKYLPVSSKLSLWGLCIVRPEIRIFPYHDDVSKWKHFPRYWLFGWGIHRSPVNSPHKGQWRGALMFSLICAWINAWVNNREAGDLKRHRCHYGVIVMLRLVWRPFHWRILHQFFLVFSHPSWNDVITVIFRDNCFLLACAKRCSDVPIWNRFTSNPNPRRKRIALENH